MTNSSSLYSGTNLSPLVNVSSNFPTFPPRRLGFRFPDRTSLSPYHPRWLVSVSTEQFSQSIYLKTLAKITISGADGTLRKSNTILVNFAYFSSLVNGTTFAMAIASSSPGGGVSNNPNFKSCNVNPKCHSNQRSSHKIAAPLVKSAALRKLRKLTLRLRRVDFHRPKHTIRAFHGSGPQTRRPVPANRSKNAPGPWRQSASGVGQTWQILPPTTQITTFSPRLLYRQPGSISSSARRTCPQNALSSTPSTTTLEVSSAFPRGRAYLLRICFFVVIVVVAIVVIARPSPPPLLSHPRRVLLAAPDEEADEEDARVATPKSTPTPPRADIIVLRRRRRRRRRRRELFGKKATIFYEGKKGS